jgi:hypothetical protein
MQQIPPIFAPQEPDALQDLFGALGMQLPSVAVPPERGLP